MKIWCFALAAVIAAGLSPSEAAANNGQKPVQLDASYEHDRWKTMPKDQYRRFRAFEVSFDGADDDNEDGPGDRWGVPHFVTQEIKRFNEECVSTGRRPKWYTDDALHAQGLAPNDASYRYPREFRLDKRNWFDRGHMAMKLLAARLGPEAEWNTHTMLNAAPQRHELNAGPWLDIELLTGAWAQEYGSVWVVSGPIFTHNFPIAWLGEPGEIPAAIPDAFFKIVTRASRREIDPSDVLAFIYPQVGPGYRRGPYDHTRFLTSVDEVEAMTGLDFFTALPEEKQKEIEKPKASYIWTALNENFLYPCRK